MRISFWDAAFRMAELVRNSIETKTGVHMWLTNNFSNADINYGRGGIRSTMNDTSFIQLCVRKFRFVQYLREKGFNDCPEFFRGSRTRFPCLVREHLDSYSAYGIHPFATAEAYQEAHLPSGYWWTPFVRCESELRVHVAGGKVLKVFKKVPIVPEDELPIRNSYNKYHYSNRENWQSWPKFVSFINGFMPLLSAEFPDSFYALDIGWDHINNRYFVFEANSAPGITPKTASAYADYFIGKFDELKEGEANVLRSREATEGGSTN